MMFNEYDFNGNGNLDFKEFQMMVQKCTSIIDEKQIRELFNAIDSNRNGVIEYQEYLKGMINHSILHQKHAIDTLLNIVEIEDDTLISRQEFKKLFSFYNDKNALNDLEKQIFQ